MTTPDTRDSVLVVKRFTYRGQTQDWSNRYHTNNALPTGSTARNTLADNIVTGEKAVIPSFVTIVEVRFYDHTTATSTNPHGDAVFTKAYTTAGTCSQTGGKGTPGDCAALVRYSTTQRTSKNHPVYLFNFYHGCMSDAAATADDLLPGQKSQLAGYANTWLTGFSDGTTTYIRCGPRGAVAQAQTVSPLITHRDFPR